MPEGSLHQTLRHHSTVLEINSSTLSSWLVQGEAHHPQEISARNTLHNPPLFKSLVSSSSKQLPRTTKNSRYDPDCFPPLSPSHTLPAKPLHHGPPPLTCFWVLVSLSSILLVERREGTASRSSTDGRGRALREGFAHLSTFLGQSVVYLFPPPLPFSLWGVHFRTGFGDLRRGRRGNNEQRKDHVQQ